MKVLYITNYGTMYGANKSLFTMISLLKNEYNIEPYVLVSGVTGDMGDYCEMAGIPCFGYDFRISAIDENTKWKPIRKFTRRIMRYVDFYKIHYKITKKGLCFDLVHSNSSIFDIGLFLAKKWNIPHVWHVREFAKQDYGLEIAYGRNAIRKKYLASSVVIAISNAIEESIKKISSDINAKRVYNGITIRPVYPKEFCSDGILKFCIIGSTNPKKNQLDVIKACDKLLQQGRKEFLLYIVGDIGGEYYEEMQHYLAEKEEMHQHIIFTGYCDDVNSFLMDKDVGIMASDKEAFGRVTIEYMANYMSVIGTNTGGTVELLEGIDNSIYALHDIEALAGMMGFYMDYPERLRHNMEIMRKRAELFSAEKNAELIYRSYEEIV